MPRHVNRGGAGWISLSNASTPAINCNGARYSCFEGPFRTQSLRWAADAGEKPQVVEIWPGKAPEEPGTIGPEKQLMSKESVKTQVEITEPARLITNVTKLTLTIYRPAKDKDTGAAVIICPGGGYWNLFWQTEGEEVAEWLNTLGVTGIILKYRVPRRPDEPKGVPARRPLQDSQRAVSLVRSKAIDWGIDPERIGITGFSAGGHLAVATATSFEKRTYEPQDDIDKVSCRPNLTILSSDNYSSPSTTTIIPDLPSIRSNVNDNYFSRSAGQLILPG